MGSGSIYQLSSDATRKLKESLLEFQATVWDDVHNCYESKIRIKNDQLGFLMYFRGQNHERKLEKSKNDLDVGRRPSKSHFQLYVSNKMLDSRIGQGHGIRGYQSLEIPRPDMRTNHGQSSRTLQEKEPPESRDSSYPRLSDYNFNISLVELVSSMKNIKEARLPKPIRSDPVR